MKRPLAGINRRTFLTGSASLLLLAACADDDDDLASPSASVPQEEPSASASAVPSDGPWRYTDDLGQLIELEKRPERIVAYSSAAAVLWDLGIEVVGTLGPVQNADGSALKVAGRIDVSRITDTGAEETDLEKLAALDPDIIVLQRNAEAIDYYPITESQEADARKIAPFVAVWAYGTDAETVVRSYERLAEALGADLNAPDRQAERTRLVDAQANLKSTLEGKSGLKVMFVSAYEDQLYVAKTADYPDLKTFQALGMDIVDPGGSEPYYEALSWENANKFPADLIFVDDRSAALQPDVLERDQPTWANLPAVKAGQIGAWNGEAVFSPRGFADAIEELTTVVAGADAAVVS
ncbi:ABC transporter substrate-binding protein [Sporichthya polymorpha]|uniref:ABC transporter substrate-binding protein n=1 Tax=Sporichthya polymorpha TaxID=35751 RepID=UPI000366A703|nr:ABC transporter substrate-binding protein [Sporichthya polymorpha]